MKKNILITGASSGIGTATAILFSKKQNYKVIACGRNQDRLQRLKEQAPEIQVLNFDVKDLSSVQLAIDSLEGQAVDILINNAGNAHGLDLVAEAAIDDWDEMIDTNLKGLAYMSRLILPQMIERSAGHIINIGSLAAKETYAMGSMYAATKHAVDAFTEALRKEVYSYGIRIGAIHPGLVATDFSKVRFKGDEERAKQVYQGYNALTAEDIAKIIEFVVEAPIHVNIADLLVLPTAQASSTLVHKKD
ncbi:MAG: SDR family NAD(P)-dependent oxidoreductase [Cyclobacteriaceae bacterium]|nr:SDR family NAD(P)-dependent oxidoreductase [Cyclobacteriaceae bacterium]MCH8515104.1 SDR family NAD(P)-dependent oxidoreductase [Cyclobacteriaceae bacterium]